MTEKFKRAECFYYGLHSEKAGYLCWDEFDTGRAHRTGFQVMDVFSYPPKFLRPITPSGMALMVESGRMWRTANQEVARRLLTGLVAVGLMGSRDARVVRITTDKIDERNMDPVEEIFSQVAAEVLRAEELWPEWPTDAIHAAAIVAEESGELVQAALQHRYEGKSRKAMRTEAIQTAAMCIRFLKEMGAD